MINATNTTSNRPESNLEYRRKNRIFFEGDYIVAINHPYQNVERIEMIGSDGFLYSDTKTCSNPKLMRHAFDDEIQVGYRLDHHTYPAAD